ncbi:KH domain-containing, RNA-binding, signal transduction-associated protein 2-like isoform X2 [Maniola jurtina]|uniref:KH domain-containing, RNA-binding, signal transduction-associated protein 2-like isoform X2 n=1 Tax=Maniola jurtina TaxID=191418 RepID=UPI001E68901E|nr:KH domain-containing, RNA-binding, signal transduction-associated protein 2-like isoform X2 [Maniola jurtina]
MADKYDKNGYNSSDFKRNSGQEASDEHLEQDGEEGAKINEKAGEYIRELLSEKIKLNAGKFPVSTRLIDQEVEKVQTTGRIPARDLKYVDVYREKPVKVVVKVLVPIKEHPKVNFIGKLMGPKGTTMKQLQEETMCKMAVLGRGSIRDRQKEEELRNSLDPKHAHLTDELHVEISALAPPAEAHARIAYALAEVKKYLIPDPSDMMRPPPHMHREIMERDFGTARRPLLQTPSQGHAAHSGPESPQDTGAERWALLETPQRKNVVYRACTVTKRSYSYQNPVLSAGFVPDAPPHAPQRPPRPPTVPRMPPQGMRGMPAKTKVLSILDRARSAMETSYPYEDPYAAPEPHAPRGPQRAPEPDYYNYERGQDRFYEDDSSYYKEEQREYKASARDVGTRRPGPGPSHARHYQRASPYQRAPKPATAPKKRSQ